MTDGVSGSLETETHRAWRLANRDKTRKYSRNYTLKNHEKVKTKKREYARDRRLREMTQDSDGVRQKERDASRRRAQKNPQLSSSYKKKNKEAIAGRLCPSKCEMCGNGGRICFDHCHATGKFRGWLCVACNMVLGGVHDDPKLLRKLAAYLEEHRGQTHIEGAQCPSDISLCWSQSILSCPG